MKHGPTLKPCAAWQTANGVLTFNWCLVARESGEPLKMGKQMIATKAGAPVDDAKKWHSIDWKEAQRHVRRLQMRIAKAVKENRWGKELLRAGLSVRPWQI